MSLDPTLLGTIQDVRGSVVSVSLTAESVAGLTFIDGEGYRLGQIGSFTRIPIGYVDLFGVVSQVGAGAVPERLVVAQPFGHRWITVQLVGEAWAGREFQRGVSQYPTIGDEVHLVASQDLARIYGRRDSPNCIRLGHLASADAIPALVDANRLISRHSAVVGATGSGKSTTVVSILRGLCDARQFPSARAVVFDIHGEYAKPLSHLADVFAVNPNAVLQEKELRLPYWALTTDELLPMTLGAMDDVSRAAVLDRILTLKRRSLASSARAGLDGDTVTADSPVPFSIHELWFDLHRTIHATHTTSGGQSVETEALLRDANNHVVDVGDALSVRPARYRPQTQASGAEKIFLASSTLNIRRQVEVLGSRLRDPRLAFFFRPGPWDAPPELQPVADLDLLLEGWVGSSKPVVVLDLSAIPTSILTQLVGVLLRILFDAMFWARNLSEGARERPILFVLEEAHAYLQEGSTASAAMTVRRLAKEGRKYGLGLMVVSQRPAEVDSTILSQCGSIIALRLANQTDRHHVAGAISDNLESLTEMLPVLRTGEAIVFGECVHLPLRLVIDAPSEADRPDSTDPRVYDAEGPGGWNRRREPSRYSFVIERWREQSARIAGALSVEQIPINSSNLSAIRYNPETLVLEVEYRNGRTYQYYDVPAPIVEGLRTAPSPGAFMNENIKGSFRYARI